MVMIVMMMMMIMMSELRQKQLDESWKHCQSSWEEGINKYTSRMGASFPREQISENILEAMGPTTNNFIWLYDMACYAGAGNPYRKYQMATDFAWGLEKWSATAITKC